MASISGQSTANIDQVDGFFTTQGSGAFPNAVLSSTGTQIAYVGSFKYNNTLSIDFTRSPVAPYTFVSMAGSAAYAQVMGVRDDGTLWVYATTGSWINQMITPGGSLNQWFQYGTDTDWEQVENAQNGWGVIKNGEYWYVGYGPFGLRGDGSTTTIGAPVMCNNSFTWTKLAFGSTHGALLSSTGEVYTTGQNNDYGTGLGVNTGTTTTWTRESSSLTSVSDISCAYRTLKIIVAGNVYTTGANNFLNSGPLVGGGAINGPLLSYNGGDIDKIFAGRDFTVGFTSSGAVRHAGQGFGKRLDNISTNLTGQTGQANEQFTLLTAAGNGWTHFAPSNVTSSTSVCQMAIQNGEAYASTDALSSMWDTPVVSKYGRVGTSTNVVLVFADWNSTSGANMGLSIS